MDCVFFQATKDALDKITAAFDFVHPLRASMQYTRRRVSEIDANVENADDTVFQAEIDPDCLIHSVGYRESYINTPWEGQEEQLAWLLLNNLFAIYEGWAQAERKGILYESRLDLDTLATCIFLFCKVLSPKLFWEVLL